MMKFKQSPVIFDEDRHTYRLENKRLLGVTGLIHSMLGLGVYPDASDHVKDFIIPRAGSRGTAVHHAIQTYDQIGVRQTSQIVRTKYGCYQRDNIRYVDETWDVSAELDAYVRHLKGFRPLANELTVSDNVRYASQIDNVWQSEKTGGIWLVDTKTNNVRLYPTCGYFNANHFADGEDALKEYLSWQLSVYAELFESENPGLTVEGLACNWLRPDGDAFWIIDRKPTDLVRELLLTEYIFIDDNPVYFHHDLSVFGIGQKLPDKTDHKQIIPQQAVGYMANLLKTVKEAEAKLDEAKTALRAAMEQHKVKKWDFGQFTATLSASSVTNRFNTKQFKEDHPEMYEKYVSKSVSQGSLTIKLKDI